MRKKLDLVERLCSFCGTSYQTRSRRSKYCSKSCGENAGKRKRAYNVPSRLKELSNAAKHRSNSKGIPHDIDGDYLLKLWEENDGCCCVTGIPFDLSYSESLQKGWSKRNAPSLDRIIPELGYTKGNVRLVTFQVNCAMGVYSDEDFYDMCKKALESREK